MLLLYVANLNNSVDRLDFLGLKLIDSCKNKCPKPFKKESKQAKKCKGDCTIKKTRWFRKDLTVKGTCTMQWSAGDQAAVPGAGQDDPFYTCACTVCEAECHCTKKGWILMIRCYALPIGDISGAGKVQPIMTYPGFIDLQKDGKNKWLQQVNKHHETKKDCSLSAIEAGIKYDVGKIPDWFVEYD